MNGRRLKENLKNGNRVYGTLLTSSAPFWAKAVQSIGLDYVFIDTEHIALNRKEVGWMCQLYDAMGLAPLVRIPSPDPYQASMVLDDNATGVVAPYIETPEQVLQLVGAVKYKPLKGARLKSLLKGESLIEEALSDYLEKHNQDRVLIVNIESTPAMEALDEILSVEGLDAILIGPHDLSCSLGIPEQYDHPKFVSAVDDIIGKAREQAIGVGIHVFYQDGVDQEIMWAEKGANLILHSADIISFKKSVKEEINQIKQSLGEAQHNHEDSKINI